jgi:hypothetical protein
MAEVLPNVQIQGVSKHLNRWAISLMVLAFATPIIAAMAGIISAGKIGNNIGQLLMGLIVFLFVTGIVSHKRGPMNRAKARLVISAFLLLCMVYSVGAELRTQMQTKQVMNEILVLEKRHGEAFSALSKKFEQVDLNSALNIKNLITQPGIEQNKAVVNEFRALLKERKGLLKANLDESENLLMMRSPSDEFREGAMAGMNRNRGQLTKQYNDLDQVQIEHADSIMALLDWCSTQVGKLGLIDGQLKFASESQRAELAKITARLQATESNFNAAVARVDAFLQHISEQRAMSLSEAMKLMVP